jgi:membrane protease YdiL (CAAX protease family)
MIIVLETGAELVAGLVLLHHEGCFLRIASLQKRIRGQWPKARILAAFVFILGMSISLVIGPVNRALETIPGSIPPERWTAAGNPTIQVNGAADVFPDISIERNYLFKILYFIIGLVFIVFGEELYYRGYLSPRMHGLFGKYDWIANEILFTLKHNYQRGIYPGILVGSLSFAFAAGPLGSLPLAILYHSVRNFLFNMIFLIMAALGVG